MTFVRSWTAELASHGIRANVISPGPTETPRIQVGSKGSPEGTSEYFRKKIPMGRFGTGEKLASAACSSLPTRAASSPKSTRQWMVAPLPGKPDVPSAVSISTSSAPRRPKGSSEESTNRFEGKVVIVAGAGSGTLGLEKSEAAKAAFKPRRPLFMTALPSVGRLHPTKSRV
jgi:hypothetical protein